MKENTKNTIISCVISVCLMASIVASAVGGYLFFETLDNKPEPVLPETYKLQQNQFGEYKAVCVCGHEVAYGYSDKKFTIKIAASDWEIHRKQHAIWKDM